MRHISKTKQIEPQKHKPASPSLSVNNNEHTHSPTSAPEQIAELQRMVGNRQTSQLVGNPIQRLMSLGNFKQTTNIGNKIRFKIKPLDWAISTYHGIPINNYARRSAQLETILSRAQRYLERPDNKAKRKDGVNQFLPHAIKEKEIMDFLITYKSTGAFKAKFDELNKAQNAVNEAEALGYDVGSLYLHISDEVRQILVDIREKQPQVLAQIMQDDIESLRAIANDPNLPAITKNMLIEVFGNIDDINVVEGKPGARHTNAIEQNQGVTEKYTIEHSLMQDGGTNERLGALTHELTHISSAETYDNTSLFMLFPTTMPAEKIIELANRRKNDVVALRNLYENDDSFSPKQKVAIDDKLTYALTNKLGLYVARFYEAKKIDENTKNKLLEVNKAVPENNTLIEFDSIVNQSLIYMHKWGISQTNPFYVKLMQVAQTSYDEREKARNA